MKLQTLEADQRSWEYLVESGSLRWLLFLPPTLGETNLTSDCCFLLWENKMLILAELNWDKREWRFVVYI